MELDLQNRQAGNNIRAAHTVGNVGKINASISDRTKALSHSELTAITENAKNELKRLDIALESLSEPVKNVVVDLYIERLNWTQVCSKRYISSNTLNRRRNQGIEEIGAALQGKNIKKLKEIKKCI